MKANCLLILIAILGSSIVHANPANEYEQIVSHALSAFDNDYKSSWAYTRTSTKDDEPAKVGYFDPSKPAAEKWTLISIGDRASTVKEQDAWALRRIQEDASDSNNTGKIVTPGSVQLLEENATHWTFSFVPAWDQFADKKTRMFLSEVTGKLRVNKARLFAEEIFLFNDKPFRAAFAVKIELFEMRMTYGPISDGGPVLLLSVDTHIQGRAFLAVSIDDVKEVRFSDYLKVISDENEN